MDYIDITQFESLKFGIKAIATFEWDQLKAMELKKVREDQNISLRNLALKIKKETGINFSFRYICNLENNQVHSVSRDKLIALSIVLGISPDYFHSNN